MKPSAWGARDLLAADRLAAWWEEQNPVRWPPHIVAPVGEFFPLGRQTPRRRSKASPAPRTDARLCAAEEEAAREFCARRAREVQREAQRVADERLKRELEGYRRCVAAEVQRICAAHAPAECLYFLSLLLCPACHCQQRDAHLVMPTLIARGTDADRRQARLHYHGNPQCDLCRPAILALFRLDPPPGWDDLFNEVNAP